MESLPSDIQEHLIFFCGMFHPNWKISNERGQVQMNAFFEYLNSDGLAEREIVIRSVQTIAFIIFGVSVRLSNEGLKKTNQ